VVYRVYPTTYYRTPSGGTLHYTATYCCPPDWFRTSAGPVGRDGDHTHDAVGFSPEGYFRHYGLTGQPTFLRMNPRSPFTSRAPAYVVATTTCLAWHATSFARRFHDTTTSVSTTTTTPPAFNRTHLPLTLRLAHPTHTAHTCNTRARFGALSGHCYTNTAAS